MSELMRPDEYDSDDDADNEFMGRYDKPRYGVISEIIPNKLYLGDYIVANDLQVLKIHKIVRVISLGGLQEQANYKSHPDIEYRWIYIDDTINEPLHEYFEMALDFIHSSPGAVYVHCWAGISRSSTIVIAYLMKYLEMTPMMATAKVRQHRSWILPNIGFQDQLIDYHQKLLKEREKCA